MNFIKAVENMISGYKLKRENWSTTYLLILPGQNYIWNVGENNSNPSVNATVYIPSKEAILAEDWVIK